MSDETVDEEARRKATGAPEEASEGEERETASDDSGDPPEIDKASDTEDNADEGAGAAARDVRQPVLSEKRINAPEMQTVYMLGVVTVSTLLMWGAGRAACNYREAGEGLSPRKTSLEARTRTPKDAAIEAAQLWAVADFAQAAKLVSGEVAAALEKDKAACQGAACEARRKAAEDTLTVGELLRANPIDAFVKVRTLGGPEGEKVRVFEVERDGREWKVTRELQPKADLPPLKDPPASLLPPVPGKGPLAPGQPSPRAPSAPGQPKTPSGSEPSSGEKAPPISRPGEAEQPRAPSLPTKPPGSRTPPKSAP